MGRRKLTDEERKARKKEYDARPENKAKDKERRNTLERKEYVKEHNARYDARLENIAKAKERKKKPENIAKAKERQQFPEYQAKEKVRRKKPERIAKEREYYYVLKLETFTNYSQKISNSDKPICACCGYDDIRFLELDHIIGRKKMAKEFDKAGSTLWLYLRKIDFPKGFQVLCTNCNKAKRTHQYCFHQIDKRKKHYESSDAKTNKKKYSDTLKLETFTNYSQKISNSDKPICACCKYDDIRFLSLDHIIGRKKMAKEFHYHNTQLWYYLRKIDFPKGFQVLCTNCNQAKRNNLECPHQTDRRNKKSFE